MFTAEQRERSDSAPLLLTILFPLRILIPENLWRQLGKEVLFSVAASVWIRVLAQPSQWPRNPHLIVQDFKGAQWFLHKISWWTMGIKATFELELWSLPVVWQFWSYWQKKHILLLGTNSPLISAVRRGQPSLGVLLSMWGSIFPGFPVIPWLGQSWRLLG